MNRDIAVRELAELCRYAGDHPRFVQGGGGNCSVKFSERMAIKASGYCLDEVSQDSGYVILDLKREQVEGPARGTISMESPLHRILNSYVIHTHPVAVAAFVCAKEGREALAALFRDVDHQWIDYASPGDELYAKVRDRMSGAPQKKNQCQVLFLQNHGLFTAAATKQQCLELHREVVLRTETFFGHEPSDSVMPDDRYLTPDQVVYSGMENQVLSARQARARADIEVFGRQVMGRIGSKGWTPVWLTGQQVLFLREMEQEKYRRQA